VVEAFFTAKGDTVYAILPRWPGKQMIVEQMSARPEARIVLLSENQTLTWRVEGNRIVVEMPGSLGSTITPGEAYVLKMTGVQTA
jgi:alpha-L-fucosidase